MLNLFKKKEYKVKDSITHTLYINSEEELKKILTNQYFKMMVVSHDGYNLDITKEDKGFRHMKATFQHTPIIPDDKGEMKSLADTIKTFDTYPITRCSVTIRAPESEKHTMLKSEKRYETVKATGGRSLCKLQKFKDDERAYCRLNTQLYSKRVGLSMDTRLTQLNLNTIIFGGSGAGKSRFFVEPNLLQGKRHSIQLILIAF